VWKCVRGTVRTVRLRGTVRWVSEAGKIRIEDDDFATNLKTLDQDLSTKAIGRLEELKAASRQS